MNRAEWLSDIDAVASGPGRSMFLVAGGVVAGLLFIWLLSLLKPTLLLVDFRTFDTHLYIDQMDTGEQTAQEKWFESGLRPGVEAQAPFVLNLRLPRIPKKGDAIAALGSVSVNDGSEYCLGAYLHYEQYPNGSRSAGKTFTFEGMANDRTTGVIPLSMGSDPRRFEIHGVKPVDGKLNIRFRLQANEDRFQITWMRSSAMKVKFAEIWECEDGDYDA